MCCHRKGGFTPNEIVGAVLDDALGDRDQDVVRAVPRVELGARQPACQKGEHDDRDQEDRLPAAPARTLRGSVNDGGGGGGLRRRDLLGRRSIGR